MSLLKQPLFHFLLLGAALFVLFELTASWEDDGARTIVVDRKALLTHLQFRARSFNPGQFEGVLDRLPDDERERLIAEYIREESLHREALSLGLDANDYILRQRLIQKMEYLARGFEVPQPDLAEVQRHYEANMDDYFVDPVVTFTHVFFSVENYGSLDAREAALAELSVLRAAQVAFADAMGRGDRFPFHRNYVDRPMNFIAAHFGNKFADRVFELDTGIWEGPLESAYGYHLVLVSRKVPGGHAPFEEVIDQVSYDAQQALLARQVDEAVQVIIDSYDIELRL